jgi:ferredoxin
MSSYRIALNFEDGVTRIIECGAKEKVLDAAFRQRINLPMDCSDGVCGTCKCRAESGSTTWATTTSTMRSAATRPARPGADLPDGAAIRLRGRRAGGLHRLQDRQAKFRQGGRGHRLR